MNGVPVSIVIPAFNEGENLPLLLDEIRKDLGDKLQTQVVVVDDGSTDATVVVAKELGAKVISHNTNKGYGEALKTGVDNADYEIIVFLDGDGKFDPEDIPDCIRPVLEDKADVVIGSRFAERLPSEIILNSVLSFLFGLRIRDFFSGFRCMKKSTFKELALKGSDSSVRYELLAKSKTRNLRITEVPIRQRMRYNPFLITCKFLHFRLRAFLSATSIGS